MYRAHYFDGHSARLHTVELDARDGSIALAGSTIVKTYPCADVKLAEPFPGAPCVLDFADGARCELAGAEARDALTSALGYTKSRVVRWQDHWHGALAALVLLVLTLGAAVKWGIPAASEHLAAVMPASADQALGETSLRTLEAQLLQVSRLSDERLAEVQQIFDTVRPDQSRIALRLIVRDAPQLGANALALPHGVIVVTDAMVLKALGEATEFDSYQTQRLAGVIAHEIGHIEARHSARTIARASLTIALSASLFGDFSAVAAGAPAVLMNMSYSRAMESEADGYAIGLLARRGIPAAPLADLFDELQEAGDPSQQLPAWMRNGIGYISSHPSSADRSARFRAADEQ